MRVERGEDGGLINILKGIRRKGRGKEKKRGKTKEREVNMESRRTRDEEGRIRSEKEQKK